MKLNDYQIKYTEEIYFEDLPFILHPNWGEYYLEQNMALCNKTGYRYSQAFDMHSDLTSRIKNGTQVFVKYFAQDTQLFGVFSSNGVLRKDLPLFLQSRLDSVLQHKISCKTPHHVKNNNSDIDIALIDAVSEPLDSVFKTTNETIQQLAHEATLELAYFFHDNTPIDDIAYEVTDSSGTLHKGRLSQGKARIANLPLGTCKVQYIGVTQTEEQEITAQRKEFSDALTAMINEIKEVAAREDALFEQESFLSQYFIKVGARATGLYQGGKSLIVGIYDLAALNLEIHEAVLSAGYNILSKLAKGDIEGLKQDLETFLANSAKELVDVARAFELLLEIADDKTLLKQLATFPYAYIDAHSIVEEERMSALFAFEILLAVLTSGAGVAVSAASQSKHLIKANTALQKLAKLLKRKKFDKQNNSSLIDGTNKDANVQPKNTLELQDQPKKTQGNVNELKRIGYIDPESIDKINDPARKPKLTEDGKVIPLGGEITDAKTINNKRNLDENGYLEKKGKRLQYDSDGFPIFESLFDTHLADTSLKTKNSTEHFKQANQKLAIQLKKNPELAKLLGLSDEQVAHILKVPPSKRPAKDLTWHHHQDTGRMQLIDQLTHDTFRHTGGMSIWGGGY